MVMCCQIWPSIAMYDHAWSCMVIDGNVLKCMGMYDHKSIYMVMHGQVQHCLVPYGTVLSHIVPLVLYGTIWFDKQPYSPVWSRMVPYGPVWSCGCRMVPYCPVSSHIFLYGPVWPHMARYGQIS